MFSNLQKTYGRSKHTEQELSIESNLFSDDTNDVNTVGNSLNSSSHPLGISVVGEALNLGESLISTKSDELGVSLNCAENNFGVSLNFTDDKELPTNNTVENSLNSSSDPLGISLMGEVVNLEDSLNSTHSNELGVSLNVTENNLGVSLNFTDRKEFPTNNTVGNLLNSSSDPLGISSMEEVVNLGESLIPQKMMN